MSKKKIISIIMLVVLVAGIALTIYGATGVGIYDNAAAIRFVEGSHDLQECCLSCATWSDYAYNLASLYVEVDAFQHFKATKTLLYVANFYHCTKTFFPPIMLMPLCGRLNRCPERL